MSLEAADIADLVASTLDDLGRMKMTDLSGDLQEYVGFSEIFKKERVTFDSGKAISFNLLTDDNNQASHTGLYQVDNYGVNDVLDSGTIPWRYSNFNYAWDNHEISMNASSEERLLDLVKVRRIAAFIAWAKLIESTIWSKPTDSTDKTTPYGVKMYVVRNASEGFNGGNPSGFTSGVAGINSSTQTRWANWTAQYTNVTKTDFIRKARQASVKTKFMPPVEISDYNTGDRFGYYTNYSVLSSLEEILEDQNENLGNDIASKDGQVQYRKRAVRYVPQLDSDAQNPFYGLNWGVLQTVFMRGWYMKEAKPRQAPNQHNVTVVDNDSQWNLKCTDRRRLFVINIA